MGQDEHPPGRNDRLEPGLPRAEADPPEPIPELQVQDWKLPTLRIQETLATVLGIFTALLSVTRASLLVTRVLILMDMAIQVKHNATCLAVCCAPQTVKPS